MNNLHLFLLFLILSACNQKVDSAYFESFYKERQQHVIELAAHEQAPLKLDDLDKLRHFDYDNTYRVLAKFSESPDATPFDMATYSGKTKTFVEKGQLRFKIDGKDLVLHVYQNVRLANHPIYGAYYFVPFKDATSNETTYGGGRYLDMKKELFSTRRIILDFNKAYNPWCAYSDGYNCPIPPVENHLIVPILAGEQFFTKEKKKS